MKKTGHKLMRGEKGQVLMLAIVLMLLGGLIIAPLLSYMSNGLKTGEEVYAERRDELYAADAGVENALWLLTSPENAPTANTTIPIDATPKGTLPNGMDTMNVTIEYVSGIPGAGTYKVTSVATSDSGSQTTIESYATTYPSFWSKAATVSNYASGTLNIQPGSLIEGDVYGEVDPAQEDQITGTIDPPYDWTKWPFVTTPPFWEFYWTQPGVSNTYITVEKGGKNILDVEPPPNPCGITDNITAGHYSAGELQIQNLANDYNTVQLRGTVYVNSTLLIGTSFPGDFTLDLNYHTIYVDGNPEGSNAIDIGPRCHIIGQGCIIAQGDINFMPNMDISDDEDFVFVMSIDGEVNFQPLADFHGSVAGNVEINLQPGCTLTHTWPKTDADGNILLNFPVGTVPSDVAILTWDISLQHV